MRRENGLQVARDFRALGGRNVRQNVPLEVDNAPLSAQAGLHARTLDNSVCTAALIMLA